MSVKLGPSYIEELPCAPNQKQASASATPRAREFERHTVISEPVLVSLISQAAEAGVSPFWTSTTACVLPGSTDAPATRCIRHRLNAAGEWMLV